MSSSPNFQVLCSGKTWVSPKRYGSIARKERDRPLFTKNQAKLIFNGNVLP